MLAKIARARGLLCALAALLLTCGDNETPARRCADGVKNGAETAVDCGGGCPSACADGSLCRVDADCQSGVCDAGLCVPSTCADGREGKGEADIDCGGAACQPCGTGKRCGAASDCADKICSDGRCAAPSCSDRLHNGRETDADCGGGACPRCATGLRCGLDSDCEDHVCSDGRCAAPTCQDQTRNGTETDADCGGACPGCTPGLRCQGPSDCAEKVCRDGRCALATCSDQVKNGLESDVDCGAGCALCGTDRACARPGDCQSGVCSDSRCAAPTCTDQARNGGESDVDCGGPCPACAVGLACARGPDCATGVCGASARCVAASCSDGVKNGGESDIDCGGPCAACAVGKSCSAGADCASRRCTAGRCAVGAIGALKVGRDGWSLFDGTSSPSQTWIKAAAPLGAGLTVVGVDTISAQSLAGLRLFVLIMDVESGSQVMPVTSDAEAQALRSFVLQGGSLAIFYGHQATYPANLGAAFDVQLVQSCEGGGTMTLTPQLPAGIKSGAWGALPATLSWGSNCHENVVPGAASKAVLIATSGQRGEAALIPPGALGAGSGPVLFVTDWYWSYSHYTDGPDWGVLFKNSIDYLMSH